MFLTAMLFSKKDLFVTPTTQCVLVLGRSNFFDAHRIIMMNRKGSCSKKSGERVKKISSIFLIAVFLLIGQRSRAQSNVDSCGNAFGAVFLWEQNMENLGQAYDTMQWYIRHCYVNANAGQTWGGYNGSWNTEVQTQAGRDSIFNFVLYGLGLRSDDRWFCYGVPLLCVKYNNSNQTPNYRDNRTIFKFLLDNPRCAFNIRPDSAGYLDNLEGQWNYWSDTSHKGEVFDSTIPTLHDLGLDTLLSLAAVANYTALGPQIILSASIMENPFQNSTNVALSIGREAYMNIGVYAVLGQQVAGVGYNGVFEQGSHTIQLDMTNVPTGTYYLRMATANNEVQTLKIVKE
jgi:hypothetical protein